MILLKWQWCITNRKVEKDISYNKYLMLLMLKGKVQRWERSRQGDFIFELSYQLHVPLCFRVFWGTPSSLKRQILSMYMCISRVSDWELEVLMRFLPPIFVFQYHKTTENSITFFSGFLLVLLAPKPLHLRNFLKEKTIVKYWAHIPVPFLFPEFPSLNFSFSWQPWASIYYEQIFIDDLLEATYWGRG